MDEDVYKTVSSLSEGYYAEKRSRFLSFALPVRTADEVKALVREYRNAYHDARHVCWAYMLGAKRNEYRSNDDGEPSSTAGKPILGQINASELTDVLIIVVRYFGGIELGTGGLTAAYRAAAANAITAAVIETRTVDVELTVSFDYPYMDKIMRIIREEQAETVARKLDLSCQLTLRIRQSRVRRLQERIDELRM